MSPIAIPATRRVTPYGDAALRVEVSGARRSNALAAAVRAAGLEGVTEAVAGFGSVLVLYDPDVAERDALSARLRAIRPAGGRRRPKTVVVPASFDGPDLEEVGRLSGLGPDGVRRALCRARLRVAMLGFAPGFAYLGGLPRALRGLPRRATPRPAVPAGSVALAGPFAALYPRATPGGWQLVGRTDLELFDAAAPPYALLQPGDTVRLVPGDPAPPGPAPARAPLIAPDGAVFGVEEPGLSTTLQDRGRAGLAHLGVPGAGPADPVSFALANALVGNDPGAACLEATALGPTLVCREATHAAVVGPGALVTLDGRPVGAGRVVPVGRGQRLAVGSTGAGLRAYVAVRGGFLGPRVLGSRSSDRLSGLGPGPLAAGDELGAGPPGPAMADHLSPDAPGQAVGGRRTLRVLATPGRGFARWPGEGPLGRPLRVEEASDRIGVRLRPEPDGPPGRGDLPSEATTVGTVQIPPDGRPVVLGVDHASLGGYPVAGVVIGADHGELGQCRPGDEVVFEPVDAEDADAARRRLGRSLGAAVAGTYPVAAG